MKTFAEALQEARQELQEGKKSVEKTKFNIDEPNIIIKVEVDPEHADESKKLGGAFRRMYDVERLPQLGILRAKVIVTKEDAEEILDMIDRKTIKILVMKVSDDLEYDSGDSFRYQDYDVKNIRVVKDQFGYLEKHKKIKY